MPEVDLSGSLISRWGGEINSYLSPEDNQHLNPCHMGSIKYVRSSQKNSDTNEVKMRAVHTPEKREEWSW